MQFGKAIEKYNITVMKERSFHVFLETLVYLMKPL